MSVALEQIAWSDDILTAAAVTNWQVFRDLFAAEVVAPGEQITVGEQSLLFTDLRGSTAMYHDLGDARAYARCAAISCIERRDPETSWRVSSKRSVTPSWPGHS